MTGRELVAAAERIVVLSGAGLSTAAGIPDFRGPQGLWTRDPSNERISTLEWYLSDEAVRRKAWQFRLNSPMWQARPTRAHRAIAGLGERLRAVITQNTDGLHGLSGVAPQRILEVHGNARRVRCEDCRRELPTTEVLDRLRGGDPDPHCCECGGILRATTVLFGENLDPEVLARAEQAVSDCDLIIAVGTSLAVYPVAGLFPRALSNGAEGIIVNHQPTPFDRYATAVLREDIDVALPRMLQLSSEQI